MQPSTGATMFNVVEKRIQTGQFHKDRKSCTAVTWHNHKNIDTGWHDIHNKLTLGRQEVKPY